MIRLRQTNSERDQLGAVAEYVDAHARQVLDHPGGPIAEADVAMLNIMRAGMMDELQQLERLFALTLNSVASEAASQLISKLMLRAHCIGVAAVHSPEAKQWRGAVQAMEARDSRERKPERIALRDAIEAEHVVGPVNRPSKEAAAILDGVNRRLQHAGFEPVKVDRVRRELEKFPRS